jgi:hypothetical protein
MKVQNLDLVHNITRKKERKKERRNHFNKGEKS